MKKIIFRLSALVCLFLSSYSCFSFNKIDSLKRNYIEQKGKQRLRTVLKIAKEYSYSNDADSTLYYANKSLKLADKLADDYSYLASKLYISAGYFTKNQYVFSRKIALEACERAKVLKFNKLVLQLGYMVGRTYQKQHKYSIAINEYSKLWDLFVLKSDSIKLTNHVINYLKEISKQISYSYFYSADCQKGIEYFKNIINRDIQSVNDQLKRAIYSNISFLYSQGNDMNLSQFYLLKALEISEKSKNPNDMYQDYAYLGSNYYNLSDYNNAIIYFEKALGIAKEQNSSRKIAWILNNLSSSYLVMGKIKNALDIKYESMDMFSKNKDSLGLGYVHTSLAENFIRWRNYKSARFHINKALKIYKKLDSKQNILASYKIICRVDVSEQKYDSLEYHNKFLNKSLIDKTHKVLAAEHLYFNGILEFYKYNNPAQTIKYFERCIEISDSINKPIVYIALNNELSKVYFSRKQYSKAIQYARKSWSLTDKVRSIKDKKDIAVQLTKCYEALNMQDSVVKYLKVQNKLNEEIFNLDNILAMYEKERLSNLDDINKENKNLIKKNIFFSRMLNSSIYSFILILTLLTIGGIILSKLRKKRFLLSIKQNEREKINIITKAEENELKLKLEITELERTKTDLCESLNKIKQNVVSDDEKLELHCIKNKKIITRDAWDDFMINFNKVYPEFFYKLRNKYPDLSPNEEKILALIKLNLKTKEMVNIMCISTNSLNMARYRLRKKMSLEKNDKLEEIVSDLN
ncbi:MAG: tetratricopeptide repeat protein [Marinifilaceae bacterium]|jgi:tetratricopeptide (TPR) repeat protein|nr:tetratricopeptide repeat protein [Marinifilaceae bacterium]